MELNEALDAVVKEIQSMTKEELEKQLLESSKTEFAKTIDMLTQQEILK